MPTQQQIADLIASQPEPKRADVQELHDRILKILPGCRLWYESGIDADGKVVANPNIGYGLQIIKYADGKTREFFQIGLSPNKTGISIYILGLADKTFLAKTYGDTIGKATVTGYCIKFKKLKDINIEVLEEAIRFGGQPKAGPSESMK